MGILEEIRECFASITNGARSIKALPNEYPAIVIRKSDGYGVAIIYNNEKDIYEKFANSIIYTQNLTIDGIENKYLILSCVLDSLRYEFATLCAQFVDPGEDGIDRINLLQSPLNWWKQWRELLGNAISKQEAYSIIAEMLVLDELFKKDSSIEWTAVNLGSHDIESDTCAYEVKSTLKKYGSTITINGQHQLNSNKLLELYFCRLEKSKLGISINDIYNKLIQDGYSKEKLEKQLYHLGYPKGSSIRDEKYKVLEKRKYKVDNKFPKIVESSFKGNRIPDSVIHITYTIDLDGLNYTLW